MNILSEVAQSKPIRTLVDKYLELSNVQGFGLSVHRNYVSLCRQEYGLPLSVNAILGRNLVPSMWPEICKDDGLPDNLSPIYVKMYIDVPVNDFLKKNPIDRVIYPGGYLLVLEEVFPFVGLRDRSKHRPIKGGISVGNLGSQNTGTIGGFVKEDNATNPPLLMSCNHVLYSPHGQDISQQGPKDGGSLTEKIGSLAHYIPLNPAKGYSYGSPYNKVDVALASILNSVLPVDKNIKGLGQVPSIVPKSQINIDDEVVFVGKESGIQHGLISDFTARKKVNINGVAYLFGDVFIIEPKRLIYVGKFARPGDSGAWVLTFNGLCGILFAGSSNKYALCCFAENIFDELYNQTGKRFNLY